MKETSPHKRLTLKIEYEPYEEPIECEEKFTCFVCDNEYGRWMRLHSGERAVCLACADRVRVSIFNMTFARTNISYADAMQIAAARTAIHHLEKACAGR